MSESLGFEVKLNQPYELAIDKATAALKNEGFGILTKIDVKATLKEKIDADFRPYAILGACNPVLAHKALLHKAEVGMMLPCNVTVESTEDGGSIIRIGDPDILLQVGDMGKDDVLKGIAKEARERLQRAVDTLSKN